MPNSIEQKQAFIEQALNKMLKGNVPVISAEGLAKQNLAANKWIVLDSRELSEYKVSHLPDALWVGHQDFSLARVADIAKVSPIAVYCSIGVRSEQIAAQLINAGYSKVVNLYGGIFSWANQGKPLVDQEQRNTTVVHGYDQSWSELVANPILDEFG